MNGVGGKQNVCYNEKRRQKVKFVIKRLRTVKKFLDNNPAAQTSDIHEYISTQDDFYEDAAYNEFEKKE